MTVFLYDKTFEGLLTCVFDAYFRHTFPDCLRAENEALPLFCDETHTVVTDAEKADRVWKGLEKKLSRFGLSCITNGFLADGTPHVDELIFRYIRKAIDAAVSIEGNFGDADVLALSKVLKQVNGERLRLLQFLRFQKTADNIYFAAFEPLHNVLPLAVDHFRDRFADQQWLVYDVKRNYGYLYDLKAVHEVTFTETDARLLGHFLDDSLLAEDELLFQQLWKTYFNSICIEERRNPRKHRQDMPVRYWKYLTEKRR